MSLFARHLALVRGPRLRGARAWALFAWRPPHDPHAYATLDVRVERALAYVQHLRSLGVHVTLTHLVAKAAADVQARLPASNAFWRWGRPHQRAGVTVCALVALAGGEGGADLNTATLRDADAPSLRGFAESMERKVARARVRGERPVERGKWLASLVPAPLRNAALKLLGMVWYSVNLDLGFLGFPRDPFGGVAVTSLGTLGITRAFVAQVPYTRTALLLAPCAVRTEPVVEAGRVAVGQVMTLSLTHDARVIDLPVAARVLTLVADALLRPEVWWGPDGERSGATLPLPPGP